MMPALEDWQVQLDSLLMGSGTPYELVVISGLDELPEIRTNDTGRPTSHGEFSDSDFASGVTVEGTLEVASTSDVGYRDALAALRTVMIPAVVMPFWFRLPGQPVLRVDGKIRRRRIPTDLLYESGLATVEFQLHSADAFKYGAESTDATGFGAPAVGAGLRFPLFSPAGVLDFGVLGDIGDVTLRNDGTAPAAVRFTVAGPTPISGFTITDTTTGKRITYLGVIPAGSQLVLDSADGSVVIDGVADRLTDTVVEAWPTIPRDSDRSFLFEPIGSSTAATLTASADSTYW